ncbi:MAG TPA: hotdog fold domain-containing protein [Gemmatimonadales bacterium]
MDQPTAEQSSIWETLQVGDDLGSFRYLMTAEMIGNYRRVVENPQAAYPTVAGRHPARLVFNRYGRALRVPNAGQDCQYFNPPRPGKWITVSGRVADKYIRRGKRYLIVEATAVDEDGRLIETCRLVGLASEAGEPALKEVAHKWQG